MEVVYKADGLALIHGDSKIVLKEIPDNTFDSIVTDPPYELAFMGKKWDNTGIAYDVELWSECLRVLKPGGHLLTFAAPRTYHRVAVAIETAGFEIRDQIDWIFGSGFPKGQNISKAIDKKLGVQGELLYTDTHLNEPSGIVNAGQGERSEVVREIRKPASPLAIQWEGWNTNLKPMHESVVMARKPISEKTIVDNVLEHGTGAINIQACRVGAPPPSVPQPSFNTTGDIFNMKTGEGRNGQMSQSNLGRYPGNVVFSHSPDCVEVGTKVSKGSQGVNSNPDIRGNRYTVAESRIDAEYKGIPDSEVPAYECVDGCPVSELDNQSGFSSRYFPVFSSRGEFVPFRYTAKASSRERPSYIDDNGKKIVHQTVKPVALMRWLVRLVTPPNGLVLDPFAGSGTTGEACKLEGFRNISIEMEEIHLPLIQQRWTR